MDEQAVRALALEQAAKICDDYARDYEGWAGGNDVAELLAERIRSLIKGEAHAAAY